MTFLLAPTKLEHDCCINCEREVGFGELRETMRDAAAISLLLLPTLAVVSSRYPDDNLSSQDFLSLGIVDDLLMTFVIVFKKGWLPLVSSFAEVPLYQAQMAILANKNS